MKKLIIILFSILLVSNNIAASNVTVGVYYYPWYHSSAAHSAYDSLRGHLVPVQHPALVDYDSNEDSVISAHIDHSHAGNIDLWVMSWWGEGAVEDIVFKSFILNHPRASELKYAILYESTALLGSMSSPDYSGFISDFDYLNSTYFSNPNYYKIDGKPVVFI